MIQKNYTMFTYGYVSSFLHLAGGWDRGGPLTGWR